MGLGFHGSVDTQPDSEDAVWLHQWMNAQGGNINHIMERAQRIGIADIGASNVRKGRNPEALEEIYQLANNLSWDASNNTSYHECPSCYVTFVKHDSAPFYMACTAEVDSNKGDNTKRYCNKKVEFDSSRGMYVCNSRHESNTAQARYICKVKIADHTSDEWVTLFDETGAKFFCCPATDV